MTDLEVQIRRLRSQGKSYKQISEEIPCSKGTVSYYLTDGQKEKSLARQRDNRKGIKRPKREPKAECKCNGCSNIVSSYGATYCSIKCKKQNKINSWLEGNWDGNNSDDLSDVIKDFIKEQAGWRCQSPDCCVPGGWSVVHKTTGRVPVQVDHIDGNCLNNSPDNLIVLCPNCHSLTLTYGSLNKNSGRTWRKKNVLSSAIGREV